MTTKFEFFRFATDALAHKAYEVINIVYRDYEEGRDIDVQTKEDTTPASKADRQTEQELRDLIEQHYPDHGILGEEFGFENLDSEYVWVLDPVDGTQEFLAKKPGHFGTLIGLLRNGKPYTGIIADPLEQTIYGEALGSKPDRRKINIEQAHLACTNIETMFSDSPYYNNAHDLQNRSAEFSAELNCMGFARCAEGEIDAVFEADLSLHDVAGLLPVLFDNHCAVIDFDGKSYQDITFDLVHVGDKKFNIIAARNLDLAENILADLKK